MKQFEKFVLGVIVGMAFVMITFIMTSCSSVKKGYGCPGQGSGMGFVGYR